MIFASSRHDVREITRIGYVHVLKPARAQLGQARVQYLNRSDIETMIRTLRDRGLSHRTVVYTLGAIRQVLAYGISAGLIATNVAASVKAPRKQHSDAKAVAVWEPAELLQFRAVADQDEWAAAWPLTLCGLRRSEVLGMRWESVDLARGEVLVSTGRVLLLDGGRGTAADDPKSTASHRTVSVEEMHPGTVALLRSLSARQAADRLVLGGRVPGDRLRPSGRDWSAHQARYVLGPLCRPLPPSRCASGPAPRCPTHAGADDAPSWTGTGGRCCPAGPHRGHPP